MENSRLIELVVNENGSRIDSWLCENTDLSRSYIQELIVEGMLAVNGIVAKQNYKVKANDIIVLKVPPSKENTIKAEDIKLDILFEDNDIIIVNKPKGMVVHPAAGNYSGTLVNALLKCCEGRLSDINGVIRPGIVHRIDKDTTGILVIAKNNISHEFLSQKFKTHDISREYIALVEGVIHNERGTIDAPLARHTTDRKKMAVTPHGGRKAISHFQVIERFDKYTLIKVKLETGRTHQIRVHMAYIGFPVVCDMVYGKKKCDFNVQGQMLHASLLGFEHPTTHEYMEFKADLPEYFENILESIKKV